MLTQNNLVFSRQQQASGRGLLIAAIAYAIGSSLGDVSVTWGDTGTSFHAIEAVASAGAGSLASSGEYSQAHTAFCPALVTAGDTFGVDIAAFNAIGTIGYLITPDEVATFGTNTTFKSAGINGQDITVSSGESVGASTTTDTITVSTPSNFLAIGSIAGTKMTQIGLDIGDAYAGGNTLDYAVPVTSQTYTGSILYGSANTSLTLTPDVTLTNGDESLAAAEYVSDGTLAISTLKISSFTFSITYATEPVPEPAAASSMGFLTLVLLCRRKGKTVTSLNLKDIHRTTELDLRLLPR